MEKEITNNNNNLHYVIIQWDFNYCNNLRNE